MLFFQVSYKGEVAQYLAGKEHVSDSVGTEQFLYYILILCAFFFMASLCMSIFMLVRRHRMNLLKLRESALIEKYQDFLSGFLVLPVDEAFIGIQKQNEIAYRLDTEDITDPYRRMLLANEIYALKKNVSGTQEQQLTNYFFGLGLQNEVNNLLNSKSWVKKTKGMQITQAFHILEYLPKVKQYVNAENRELAIQAICIAITITKSIDVLFDVDRKLNNWECHKIADTIKRLKLNISQNQRLMQAVGQSGSYLSNLALGIAENEPAALALQN